MFEVGWSEYLVIFGLALVVLGPEKLPKLAASIGRWVGRARVMARQFRDQLETEAEGLRNSVQDVHKDFHSAATDIQTSVSEVKRDFEAGMSDPSIPVDHAPLPEPPPHASHLTPQFDLDTTPTAELPALADPAPPAETAAGHPPAEGPDEHRH